MSYILKGLASIILGFTIAFLFTAMELATGKNIIFTVFIQIGIWSMVLGPIYFWIGRPIYDRYYE